MEQEPIKLSNLCGGAVEEMFQRELKQVLENIADVNTDSGAQRKITLELVLAPFDDRSGAQVSFSVRSKTVPGEAAKGTLFLQRRGVSLTAFPHDPRQARMFSSEKASERPS